MNLNWSKLLVHLVVALFCEEALGNENDVETLAETNGGLGMELVQTGLENLQYSFLELFVHVKELGEIIQNNQRSIEQTQLQTNQLVQRHQRQITNRVDNLEASVAANITLMTSYSKQILGLQTICANHDLIKRVLQKLKPHATVRSSLKTLIQTELFTEPKLEQFKTIAIDSCGRSSESGLFYMSIPNRQEPISVFCELRESDGVWLVVQQRINEDVDFYRNWTEYKNGFGYPDDGFWIGLDNLHEITQSDKYALLIEMRDFSDNLVYARYSHFVVGNEGGNYVLEKLGQFSGTAHDSLSSNVGRMFSTFDVDNDDNDTGSCAFTYSGAWWHGGAPCYDSNLNGNYSKANNFQAITWYSSTPLKYTRMMIQRNREL